VPMAVRAAAIIQISRFNMLFLNVRLEWFSRFKRSPACASILAFAGAMSVCVVPANTRRLARQRVHERPW
jgi:hypothetical protein